MREILAARSPTLFVAIFRRGDIQRRMLLFLVRHGVTAITGKKLTGWLPGFNLSEEGTRQAKATAERLRPIEFSAVYSSPLERCFETATILSEGRGPGGRGQEVEKLDDVGEIRYGDWQGKTMVSLYKSRAWKQLKARPADFRFPNGETIREAQTRGMAAIERLLLKHKDKSVLVCSHADLIRVLVSGYLGLPLDLYDRISIAPASVTVLLIDEGGSRALRISDIGEFDELAETIKARTKAKKS